MHTRCFAQRSLRRPGGGSTANNLTELEKDANERGAGDLADWLKQEANWITTTGGAFSDHLSRSSLAAGNTTTTTTTTTTPITTTTTPTYSYYYYYYYYYYYC